MRDEAWGDVEESFFAAGDAISQQTPVDHAEPDPAAPEAMDVDQLLAASAAIRVPPRLAFQRWANAALTRSGRWSSVKLARAARWSLWRVRLLHFRLTIALWAGAEHALRAANSTFRPLRPLVIPLRPLVIPPRPRLARACLVVLITIAHYSAAAIAAASGL